jgi:hypothetical protein
MVLKAIDFFMQRPIQIDFIPHGGQRLGGNVGDYFYDPNGVLHIVVSSMGIDKDAWLYERLVAIHELCEQTMTEYKGITESKIQYFDELYYAEEHDGVKHDTKEAGWDLRSPYRLEHGISETIERLIATLLGITWEKYEQRIDEIQG